MFRIYKELLQINKKKTRQPIKEWSKDLNVSLQKRTPKWPIDTWNSISPQENATQKHNELVLYIYQNGQN